MNFTALIVDDEYPCRETLRELVTKYCASITKVWSAQNIGEALSIIRSSEPQIIFLDINMPDGTGFDLLSQLSGSTSKVIFTTAYDDYAVKAFRYSAVDYLMKPINISELQDAVSKCASRTQAEAPIEAMKYYHQNKIFNKILVSTVEDYFFIEISEIITIAAEGNYSLLKLNSGKHMLVTKQIGEFEDMLSSHGFYRIHHSNLINFNYLESINKKDNEVTMRDASTLVISGRRKLGFLKFCHEFSGMPGARKNLDI